MNFGKSRKTRLLLVPFMMLMATCVFFGCAGSKSKKAASIDSAKTGDTVTIEGTLSLRGSAPFPLLLLEIDGDRAVLVESSTMQTELKSLAGMSVSLEGVVLPSLDKETAVINAQKYELLPLPSGDLPLVGVISTFVNYSTAHGCASVIGHARTLARFTLTAASVTSTYTTCWCRSSCRAARLSAGPGAAAGLSRRARQAAALRGPWR